MCFWQVLRNLDLSDRVFLCTIFFCVSIYSYPSLRDKQHLFYVFWTWNCWILALQDGHRVFVVFFGYVDARAEASTCMSYVCDLGRIVIELTVTQLFGREARNGIDLHVLCVWFRSYSYRNHLVPAFCGCNFGVVKQLRMVVYSVSILVVLVSLCFSAAW